MDDESAHNLINSRTGWPVVIWLSRFLEGPEREAVLGDLVERGEGGRSAVLDVLGLVVRRRTRVLVDLRLWIAFAFVLLPVSCLLSAIAQTAAGEGAIYSWMYLNNWDWSLTRNPGFWHVLRETAMHFGIVCLAVSCWAWSGGFLVGRLPNGIFRASRNAFIVLLVASQLGDVPARIFQFRMYLHGLPLGPPLPDVNAPVTANVFYSVFFPWLFLAILVILPAFSGIRQGNRLPFIGEKMGFVLATAATISVFILVLEAPESGMMLGGAVREWLWRNRNTMQVLPLLSCWPILYLIVISFERHRNARLLRRDK